MHQVKVSLDNNFATEDYSFVMFCISIERSRWRGIELVAAVECQRHPRRWSARFEGIDRCSRINDDGDQHDRDTSKGR
jgi:hypothetical protein